MDLWHHGLLRRPCRPSGRCHAGLLDDEPDTALIDTPDGRRIPVSTFAAQVLDISDDQADELFNAGSLDELEGVIRDILGHPSAGTGAFTAA